MVLWRDALSGLTSPAGNNHQVDNANQITWLIPYLRSWSSTLGGAGVYSLGKAIFERTRQQTVQGENEVNRQRTTSSNI
jgi:hypothetical protein